MSVGQMLLPEFDTEMRNTRTVIQRVPEDKLDWKVHQKSNTIGWVANHLAEIPGWTPITLNQSMFDLDPPGGEPFRPTILQSKREMLDLFDKNVVAARQAIAAASDATWLEPWSLLKRGEEIFTMPKFDVIRSFVLNHTIHHRAHLCVYLRMHDVPIPGLYGPSGDEMDPPTK